MSERRERVVSETKRENERGERENSFRDKERE